MNYVLKGNHHKNGKINIIKVFCVSIIAIVCVAIIVFMIYIINKQDVPVSKANTAKQDTIVKDAIVIDKSDEDSDMPKNQENKNQYNKNVVQEQNNEQPRSQTSLQVMKQNNPIQHLPNDFSALSADELERFDKIYSYSDPKRIFLTFDDGPTTQVTPYILDLLKSENIKATFFVLGNRVDANPELVKREYEEGHFIANHGYTHKYSAIYQSSDTVLDEYNRTNQSIRNAIGNQEYNSLVFRFPGGSIGGKYDSLKKATKQILRERGIASIDWNALNGDTEGVKTTDGLYDKFVQTASSYTSIVLLMHDAADKILTYETLPRIIEYCRNNGYEFKTMYDLLLRN